MLSMLKNFNSSYSDLTFNNFLRRRLSRRIELTSTMNLFDVKHVKDDIDSLAKEYFSYINTVLTTNISDWAASIKPWSILIDSGEKGL